jgi:hypothetical protein
LSAVADRIGQLIRTLESFRPGSGAGAALTQAWEELLSALHPSVKDWRDGEDTDITESDLDGDEKARLLDLRDFLLDGSFHWRATRKRIQTIAHLKGLLKGLLTEGEEAGADAYLPANAFLDDVSPTYKAIRKALARDPRIRRRRPRTKDGREDPHRLEIHAADWKRFRDGPRPADPLDVPAAVADVEVREAEARRRKEHGCKGQGRE